MAGPESRAEPRADRRSRRTRQMLGERSEDDTFQCLAWLYEGFALPERRAA